MEWGQLTTAVWHQSIQMELGQVAIAVTRALLEVYIVTCCKDDHAHH